MVNRRDFIKTLPGIPAALRCGINQAAAADNASKVCLVVGNGAYPHAQLRNPVNDARAMSDLFTAAGFSVDFQQDVKLDSLRDAVERFGETVQRPNTKLAVFYYAGHGVQLEWRNYLLPVDAEVSTADELKARCMDLGLLLGKFASAKDKTHVVFLDACRSDPFGGSYHPAQAGLSQFDAPVGSLLAYATAPGSVALDGQGTNGLYTLNLVRELTRRDAQLEDALKRVRLNVRLESQGLQIPWESTSLESDVYIFDDGRKPLSDVEIEESVKEDLATWERIKSSHDAQDWIGYLRAYPNGRFAEIAQERLTRLLAMQVSVPVTSGAIAASAVAVAQTSVPASGVTAAPVTSTAQPMASATPAAPLATAQRLPSLGEAPEIVIEPGAPPPKLIRSSGNPYSAGIYPLGRLYSVGDEASFRSIEIVGGLERSRYSIRITKVDLDADRVEGNDGRWIFDSMGNPVVTPESSSKTPKQLVPAEFQIGKKWSAAWTEADDRWITEIDLKIVAREVVRAGGVDFVAFRVESHGIVTHPHKFTRLDWRHWYVPGLNFAIAAEYVERRMNAGLKRARRIELVTLRQQKTGLSNTVLGGAIPHHRMGVRAG
jgi:uncharacterized caspase-like protein